MAGCVFEPLYGHKWRSPERSNPVACGPLAAKRLADSSDGLPEHVDADLGQSPESLCPR